MKVVGGGSVDLVQSRGTANGIKRFLIPGRGSKDTTSVLQL